MHLAFWLPLGFAVPLFVILNNREELSFSPLIAGLVLAALTGALTGLSTRAAGLLRRSWRRQLSPSPLWWRTRNTLRRCPGA